MIRQAAIGIDIGGTRTKIGLVDLDMGNVSQIEIVPTETKNAATFEESLRTSIDRLKARAMSSKKELLGIGIGVSSFVHKGGIVDSTYGFIDFMEDYPLARKIEKQHHLPCRIDNDARLVALGEALYGKGKGYNRVLVLTLGTGLGVGMVLNNKLDGELPYGHMGGHISIVNDGAKCYCGKTGCLESLISASGLLTKAKQWGWLEKNPKIPLNTEAIFHTSKEKNKLAEVIVHEFLGHLKTGISNYTNLFAPELIVLGGGIAKGIKEYLPILTPENTLGPFKNFQTTLKISELEENAGILGSAALFL